MDGEMGSHDMLQIPDLGRTEEWDSQEDGQKVSNAHRSVWEWVEYRQIREGTAQYDKG